MIVYNSMILGVLLLGMLSTRPTFRETYVGQFLRFLCFSWLFIVSGFRYYVGTDYENYLYFYKLFPIMDKKTVEPGYYLLNKVLYPFSQYEQFIFVVTSLISIGFIFYTLHKYSIRFELSLFLFICMFFYFSSFNIIRQYIAIGISFYGLTYIREEKSVKYIMTILLASTFHITALIMLPFYWIGRKLYSLKVYLVGIGASIVILQLLPLAMKYLFLIINRYEDYQDSYLYGASIVGILPTTLLMLFALLMKEKLLEMDARNGIYINAVYLSWIFQLFSMEFVLFSRISIYFSIYSLLLIPYFIGVFEKRSQFYAYTFFLLFYFIMCNILLLRGNGGLLPYAFQF